jgi:hypothetical protein
MVLYAPRLNPLRSLQSTAHEGPEDDSFQNLYPYDLAYYG